MKPYGDSLSGVMIQDSGGPLFGSFKNKQDLIKEMGATVLELNVTSYARIRRLMQAYEQSTPDTPQWPSEADFRLRVRLDLEEFFEKIVLGYYSGNPKEIIDGGCDVEVVGTGATIAFGVNHEFCIAEVDRSNLSKLGENGRPIKDEFGKAQKGPNYSPPDIMQFLGELVNTPAPYDTRKIVSEEFRNVLFGSKNFDRNLEFLRDVGLYTAPVTQPNVVEMEVTDDADTDSSAALLPAEER